MKTKFDDFAALNSHIAFEVRDALRARGFCADYGASNISESAYVSVAAEGEDDDLDTIKLRFSGHSDRHGADRTWRTDEAAEEIYSWSECGDAIAWDEDGEPTEFEVQSFTGTEDESGDGAEFSHVEIDADRLAAIISEAVAMVTASQKVAA